MPGKGNGHGVMGSALSTALSRVEAGVAKAPDPLVWDSVVVFRWICEGKGRSVNSLSLAASLPWRRTKRCLEILVGEGLVALGRWGFYPTPPGYRLGGKNAEKVVRLLEVLPHPTAFPVLRLVISSPGIYGGRLARILGMRVESGVEILVTAGLVDSVKDGRHTRLFPSRLVAEAVEAWDPVRASDAFAFSLRKKGLDVDVRTRPSGRPFLVVRYPGMDEWGEISITPPAF
ncbi:MAG: helix-turn-helix transcriptional regulator [Thermoplasmata archaeon]|nr:helix-turn-helix transcriptional regulator [Thermoplasmata archaeon]